MDFTELLRGIMPADQGAITEAKEHNDSLLKPLGSLGDLESIAIKVAGITGKRSNCVEKRCVIVMAADNGICDEGIAGTPQGMTLWQTKNIAEGISGVGVLAKYAGADLKVVDIGIKGDVESPLVIQRKVKNGTENFAKEPAMKYEQAIEAIMVGADIVAQASKEGYQLLGTGEMGIGNTSSTGACVMALTGLSADQSIGKGGGLTDEGLLHKKEVIADAVISRAPNVQDPIDVLSKVGGLDIAGMVGCFLGAAYYKIPIVIDGAISILAALIAFRLAPNARDYMFASHKSKEPSYMWITEELGITPVIDLNMRLGEGTGCPLVFPIIGAACSMLSNMHTFEQAQLDQSYRIDIRKGDK